MDQSDSKKLWSLAARSAIEPLELRRMLSVSFTQHDWPAGGIGSYEVGVGDFNEDGRADLAVAGYDLNILIANDSGGFFEPVFYPTLDFVADIVKVADFNEDDHADLMVGMYYVNKFAIYTGDGSGGFSEPAYIDTDLGIADAAVGDFNNDGRPDLAITNIDPDTDAENLTIYINDGNGGFDEGESYSEALGTVSVADFNGDGRADLVVGHTYHFDGYSSVLVYIGNGEGGFSQPVSTVTGYGLSSVAVGDFNADGRADLAVCDPWPEDWKDPGEVLILIGDGNGGFAQPVHYVASDEPVSVAIGDFNGDGSADLAVANIMSDDVNIFIGNGNGGFSWATNLATANHPRDVTVGDFNYDGRADLAIACDSGDVTIQTNLSTDQWAYNPSNPFIANSPWHIPGKIEFENYDVGGEGTAYHDSTSFNSDGVYRSGGVDIVEGGTEYQLYDTHPGEWTAYSVTVPTAGMYQLDVFAGASGTNARFHMTVDNVDVTGPLTPHNFHSDNSNGLTTLGGISLSAGEHEIRFYYDVESGNSVGAFDWFSLTSNSLTIPHVTASSFNYQTSPQSVSITFDMDIEPTSLSASDLQVRRHPNATAFAPASVNYNPATRTATFYFNTPLADGNYSAKLLAGSVQTPAGNVSPEYSMSFFTLAGDANRDRVVNFSDLLIVAQNYGQSNRNFSQGNFDYSADGLVNFNDLLIVAQRYGTSLPALRAPMGVGSSSTFGATRIAGDVLGDEQRERNNSRFNSI